MTGSDSDAGASAAVAFPPAVQARLEQLQGLQHEHDLIEAKLRVEMEELERKFRKQCMPLYQQRAELLKADPPIPRFWLTAMKNHFMLAATITETDELALASLLDIRALLLEPGHGFKLEFEFAPNDYFTDAVLSKTYHFKPADLSAPAEPHEHEQHAGGCCGGPSEASFEGAEGSEIHWKEGKNLCVRTVTKTQRHKTKNATRTVTKAEPCESFFNFFAPPKLPELSDSVTQEEFEDLSEAVEMDLEFGEIFRTKIVPEAVNCFLGIADGMQSDDEDFGEEDFDEEDEDDEDADEDEDDDEEDDEDEDDDEDEEEASHRQGGRKQQHASRAKPSRRAQMPAGAAQQQPQCKQQ